MPGPRGIPSCELRDRLRCIPWQAAALALLTGSLNAAIALGYTGPSAALASDASLDLSEIGWIAAQSLMLVLPGICLVLCFKSRLGFTLGASLTFASPALLIADAITFRWIGQRLFSEATLRVFTDLRSGLVGHVSSGMLIRLAIQGGVLFTAILAILYVSRMVGGRFQRLGYRLTSRRLMFFLCVLIAAAAVPALCDPQRTSSQMQLASWRHPICAIGFNPMRRIDVSAVEDVRPEPWLQRAIASRETRHRLLAIEEMLPSATAPKRLPDVLIVVVESFRPELLEKDVMPNLYQLSSRGIQCRSHFSGGNATNHGVFSLLNGLEAIWYESPIRFSPTLNRLLRSVGYEIGFFAGHNDWRKFYMDAYLSDEHFDLFETSAPNGLDSDRRATQLAADFLNVAPDERPPRLALLYLYATHATYQSYAEDQLFQPAADARFLYPFSSSSRARVWNRYKNSARTVDRFLGSVFRDDRVVIVTGDHGESFLEDATVGHGSRISQFQNMTPAVVYVPGRAGRTIEHPTFHADLLPTLVSALGGSLTDPSALDGMDLDAASDQVLADRIFATRNYLSDDIALIGPWTRQVEQPFAYRALFSLGQPAYLRGLDSIDFAGQVVQASDESDVNAGAALRGWIASRFGLSDPQ